MTRNEVVKAAKAAGYTKIETAHIAIPIDEWTPYGATEDDERTVYGGSAAPIVFTFIDDGQPRIEDSIPAGLPRRIAGVWRLGKG
jgi:hypothetical protein